MLERLHGSKSSVWGPNNFQEWGTKWPKLRNDLQLTLTAKEIKTNAEGKVNISILMRSVRTQPVKEVLTECAAGLTAEDLEDSLKFGDYRLTPKNPEAFRDAEEHKLMKIKHAF